MTKNNRILVVLDINGTLLDRFNRDSKCLYPAIAHDFTINKSKIYLRPHLDEFLCRLSAKFTIAAWTSAMPTNAIPMISRTFLNAPLLFKWTRVDCDIKGYKNAAVSYKDLSKIYSHTDPALNSFTERNTLILDDSPYKSSLNQHNALHLPTYTVRDPGIDPAGDTALLSVLTYLYEMHEQFDEYGCDVRKFLARNQFCTTIERAVDSPNHKKSHYTLAKREEPDLVILDKYVSKSDRPYVFRGYGEEIVFTKFRPAIPEPSNEEKMKAKAEKKAARETRRNLRKETHSESDRKIQYEKETDSRLIEDITRQEKEIQDDRERIRKREEWVQEKAKRNMERRIEEIDEPLSIRDRQIQEAQRWEAEQRKLQIGEAGRREAEEAILIKNRQIEEAESHRAEKALFLRSQQIKEDERWRLMQEKEAELRRTASEEVEAPERREMEQNRTDEAGRESLQDEHTRKLQKKAQKLMKKLQLAAEK